MGIKGARWYVYRVGFLGLRTNVPPEMWTGEVDEFLESCPEGWQIGFDIKDGKIVESGRSELNKPVPGVTSKSF